MREVAAVAVAGRPRGCVVRIVIPAAGEGRRCRPWSAVVPKPLLPVANRPMLAHVLDDLLPLGPERVVVVTGWLGGRLEAWVREAYPEMPAAFARQEGGGGPSLALLAAREHLAGPGLIVYPDMLFRLDPALLAAIGPEIDAAVFTAEPPSRAGFAIAETGPDGLVRRIVEKPAAPMAGEAVPGCCWGRGAGRRPRRCWESEPSGAGGVGERVGRRARR
ncbi:MAG: NTP transferase domain-containing protein, partial [Chloroflexota bacterium]